MSLGFYLYGILPEPLPDTLAIAGLDRQPVHNQTIEGFHFLYSEAKQTKYLTSRRNLLGHEKVLEEAMTAGFRTLLPLRFGLVVKTWDTVIRDLIDPYQGKLEALFQKLEGRREVSVKVFWESKNEIEALLEENPSLKQMRDASLGRALSMEEVINIGQMIESSLKFRKQAVIAAFQTGLNPLAEEVIESDPMTEEMIYNAAYLIPWDREQEFSDAVEAIDKTFGSRLRIRYNNFTAPYTFAQLESEG
ncbi:GvpL/GvpF family gas vesicle protein [Oscillatoria acuminata]|uniref:Gas vesicle synthesis protein GvpL/GvpF n=1 Tax=Oscillatoria acuminata PCC 6304 TaxID=56110 RepID=K9TD30_9CYAN|nr:GvpL/GvpF family gas vesicle protein [Oscillatoria acuminata]AFY79914.1 Gas vesicle synthesis protein GvpL/GvpF [Oscillatoria acuminata PCC 6304]